MLVPSLFSDMDDDDDHSDDQVLINSDVNYNFRRSCVDRGFQYVINNFVLDNSFRDCYCHEIEQRVPVKVPPSIPDPPDILFNYIENYWVFNRRWFVQNLLTQYVNDSLDNLSIDTFGSSDGFSPLYNSEDDVVSYV